MPSAPSVLDHISHHHRVNEAVTSNAATMAVPDATAGPDTSTGHAMPLPGYTVREKPLGTPRHIRIVGIGAGGSGINMVRTLRRQLPPGSFEHVVYEKNADVGGTWYENRYPGCRCDVPSHNYQFSWRPNPAWSNFSSPAEEIEAYLCRICDDEGMRDVIKTEHEVVSAHWSEETSRWNLTVAGSGTRFDDYADFLIDASGILNNWKWPDIEGLHAFKGDLIHTARWPAEFDCREKRVAVIGNGSSGVQLVPALQPQVQQLVHVVRSPTWVIPPLVQIYAMGEAGPLLRDVEFDDQENFTAEQIERFKTDPAFYRTFVKTIEEASNRFPLLLKDSPVQASTIQLVRQYMTAMLGGDERLCKALIPDYPLGCRRMTPVPAYLPALAKANVQVVTDGVRRVLPEGMELASGEVIPLDTIVCATGFDLSFRPRFPLVGRSGNLQDLWSDRTPEAYMSCAVPGMPNYFTFFGPNAPIGHGSVFTLSEHVATYIAGVIRKCQTEGIRALAPSQDAVDDYSEHIRAFMPRTVWSGSCSSWFKGEKQSVDDNADTPHVTALHPGSRIHFFHMLETFRGEDFEYVYATDDGDDQDAADWHSRRPNRFRYLGNGFSTKELDPAVDKTWYLDDPALTGGIAGPTGPAPGQLPEARADVPVP